MLCAMTALPGMSIAAARAWACASFAAFALGACGGFSFSEKPESVVTKGSDGAPVALAPTKAAPQTVAMSVNQEEVAKAVERLRMTKKKKESSFDQAGADLNSDGRTKALVLFSGQDWCSPQGCTLVVFEPSDVGYRPISQIVGVKAPVAVGAASNAGWRDLIVKTGANKIVRLQFTGGGYPTNAATQPDAASDAAQSEVLIQQASEQTAFAAPVQAEPR
jgi:hypothetical protein